MIHSDKTLVTNGLKIILPLFIYFCPVRVKIHLQQLNRTSAMLPVEILKIQDCICQQCCVITCHCSTLRYPYENSTLRQSDVVEAEYLKECKRSFGCWTHSVHRSSYFAKTPTTRHYQILRGRAFHFTKHHMACETAYAPPHMHCQTLTLNT